MAGILRKSKIINYLSPLISKNSLICENRASFSSFLAVHSSKTCSPIRETNARQTKFLPSTTNISQFRQFSTTKTESSLVDFLKDEIEAEKKLGKQQLAGAQQPGIAGFQVKTDQREVVLTKQHGAEKITVTFDINHTVDSDAASETEVAEKPAEASQEPPLMVSKPNFIVEVQKGDQKLAFECAFVEPDYSGETPPEEEYADMFNIEEVYMYTGEFSEKNKIYAVSGGIIDGTLYDHLMNYLEERGIDNEFAQNLSRYATFYEHGQYVSLLQKLRDFVSP